jgi:hypothetical protein
VLLKVQAYERQRVPHALKLALEVDGRRALGGGGQGGGRGGLGGLGVGWASGAGDKRRGARGSCGAATVGAAMERGGAL